ncbi:MAG: hypothetical protein WAM82_04195 [Thermoanaerobaculia bacterium]
MEPQGLDGALRSLSKLLDLLAAAILLLSAYLVQRAAEILVYGLDPLSRRPQIEQYGLKFSYLTLSVVWPIAAGLFAAAFAGVRAKRDAVVAAMAAKGIDVREARLADAFYITIDSVGQRRLLRILGWAPLVSIVTLAASQLSVALVYSPVLRRSETYTFSLEPRVWVAVNAVLQVLSAGVGIWLTATFACARQFERACNELTESVEPPNQAVERTEPRKARPRRSLP